MMRTISDVIEAAGGVQAIRAKAGVRDDGRPALTQQAISYWRTNGIPEKHWSMIIELTGASTEQLHRLNEALRRNGV